MQIAQRATANGHGDNGEIRCEPLAGRGTQLIRARLLHPVTLAPSLSAPRQACLHFARLVHAAFTSPETGPPCFCHSPLTAPSVSYAHRPSLLFRSLTRRVFFPRPNRHSPQLPTHTARPLPLTTATDQLLARRSPLLRRATFPVRPFLCNLLAQACDSCEDCFVSAQGESPSITAARRAGLFSCASLLLITSAPVDRLVVRSLAQLHWTSPP
jgi:hypothetical protein